MNWLRMPLAIVLALAASVAICQVPPADQQTNLSSNEKPPDPAWLKEKARLQRLGEDHKSAWDLYQDFKRKARGGAALNPAALPDWTGIFQRDHLPFQFDPDTQGFYAGTTAKLKPGPREAYQKRLSDARAGIEFDPLGGCLPAGMPRWFSEPFAREFIVTPRVTYLANELANEMRRIYTDGREHPAPDDAYATFDGDSIGFWDGNKLIVHTQDMMAGLYQRAEPEHTDNVQTVEVWQKTTPSTIVVDLWIYDPEMLEVPWYTRQTFKKMNDQSIRIHYYDCVGTPNTQVIKLPSGETTFKDLDFDKPHSGGAETQPPGDSK